jgi:hypothetical protein
MLRRQLPGSLQLTRHTVRKHTCFASSTPHADARRLSAAASESSSAALAAEAKRVATASHAAELDAGAKARDLHLHSSALLEDAPASRCLRPRAH